MKLTEQEKKYHREYYQAHKEKKIKQSLTWAKENKEKKNLINAEWKKNHPEQVKDTASQYAKSRRAWWNAKSVKSKAKKLNAIASWIDLDLVGDMYEEARYFGLVVDHIVPLNSKIVCGLHWEGNLQLLTSEENCAKGNSYWPDMPTDMERLCI